MTDWDEVKRLAADFQKVQLSSSIQKLSERNCIEIVTWLMQRKVIDLIYTTDGKEYLTPAQLISDIRGELYMSGGRVNLVDLAKAIGVDLSHINASVSEVLRGHKDIHSVLGQLIDSTYLTRIAGEINEKLVAQGQINVSDLTIQYDLPAEFIQQQVLEKTLGKLIFGQQDKTDPRVYFTESFIARTKSKIRGALAGLTRPTPIPVILNHTGISEKLFFSLFDQVSMFGTLTSRVSGAIYIPNIYSRSQHEWTTNFYKQNNYIEFDALARLGITDYKTYLRKLYPRDSHFLNSCLIGTAILDRIEADIDEAIISRSFLDLQANLPSVLNDEDIKKILELVLKNHKQRETVVLESEMGHIIISQAFMETLVAKCEDVLNEQAKAAVESGKFQQYQTEILVQRGVLTATGGGGGGGQKVDEETGGKAEKREERRKKAAGGKTGGGTQGRETKTKSTKKGGRLPRGGGNDEDSDSEVLDRKPTLTILTSSHILDAIQDHLEAESLDHLSPSITSHLLPNLNARALELAQRLYETTVSDRTASRRDTHNEIQTKVNTLLGDIRLFDKGVKLVGGGGDASLYKYLQKTVCMEVVGELLDYLSAEEGGNLNTTTFTTEQRTKFVNELLPASYRPPLQALIKSLNTPNVDDFMATIDGALAVCSMIQKKVDKKKDRLLILNHKHGLLEQLSKCDEPALVLHMATLVLFVTATQCMIHASGRHVSTLLAFLKPHLTVDVHRELTSYHDMMMMTLGGSGDEAALKESLQQRMQTIKDIANEYKKPSSEKS